MDVAVVGTRCYPHGSAGVGLPGLSFRRRGFQRSGSQPLRAAARPAAPPAPVQPEARSHAV
jgi:hypothetical protein